MNLSVKSTIETFQTIEKGLNKGNRLYYTRFGDGEIVSMMGKDHRNYKFSPELQQELFDCFTINHPDFLIATAINLKKEKKMSDGVFAPFSWNSDMEDFILTKGLINQTGVYENYIAFHYLSIFNPKLIYGFFEKHIRLKKKMFIGCTPKNIAEKLYGKIDFYVETPRQNAYDSIEKWWPKVLENVDNVELVIPSAGAASNVISKRLWKLDKNIHLLDIGSIIDAVELKASRTWIRLVGHRVNKVLPKKYREKRVLKRIVFTLKDIKYFFRRLIV